MYLQRRRYYSIRAVVLVHEIIYPQVRELEHRPLFHLLCRDMVGLEVKLVKCHPKEGRSEPLRTSSTSCTFCMVNLHIFLKISALFVTLYVDYAVISDPDIVHSCEWYYFFVVDKIICLSVLSTLLWSSCGTTCLPHYLWFAYSIQYTI
jgi:hypothetical protein